MLHGFSGPLRGGTLVHPTKHNGSLCPNQGNHCGGATVATWVTPSGPSTLSTGAHRVHGHGMSGHTMWLPHNVYYVEADTGAGIWATAPWRCSGAHRAHGHGMSGHTMSVHTMSAGHELNPGLRHRLWEQSQN